MNHKRLALLLVTLFLALALASGALAADLNQDKQPPAEGAVTTLDNGGTVPDKGAPEYPVLPSPQSAGLEAVSAYIFSQTTGTYTEITGGTQVTTSCDDTSFGTYSIGFNFIYDGVAYTTFGIQCNGFIALGAFPSNSYTPISSGLTKNVIVGMGSDQQTNTSDSEIRYQVLGSAPNRVLVVQYKNFRHYNASGQIYNFQILLHEANYRIEVVYGSFTPVSTYTQQVGLRGASSADFNNRSSATGWTNTVAGTLNTDSVTLSSTYYPPSGLTFTWDHPPYPPNLSSSTKSASASVVSPGEVYAYTVNILNTGDLPATDIVMTDTIPAGVDYVPGSVTCNLGDCWYDSGADAIYWSGDLALDRSEPYVAPEISGRPAKGLTDLAQSQPTRDPEIEAPPQTQGVVLVNQPPNQANGLFTDLNCDICAGTQVIAENFQLATPAQIEQIILWSGYYPGDVPIDPDMLTVFIHEDNGGLPGNVVYSESPLSYTRVQTGVILFGVHEWQHTLTLMTPVTLDAGNYWVEIFNDTGTGTDDFFWETGNLDPVNGLPGMSVAFEAPGSTWYPDTWDLSMQIIGTPINDAVVSFQVQVVDPECGGLIYNEATINSPDIPAPVVVSNQVQVWDYNFTDEAFEGTFPPDGWTVISETTGTAWTNVDVHPRGNLTGGSGSFAIVDDDHYGSGALTDTSLWLPAIDFPVCADLYLTFNSDYNQYTTDFADIDYSLDGGDTWNNITHWTTDRRGPVLETIYLSPFVSGQNAILRFHYDDDDQYAWWWEIDNVKITGCGFEGLLLTPDVQFGNTVVGEDKTYDLKLQNCTYQEDTFDLQVMDNNWLTWFSAESVVLPHGGSADMTVTVEPACDAEGTDTANLYATGQSYGAMDWAQVNTTILPGFFTDAWQNMATGAEVPLYWGGSYYYDGQVCVLGGLVSTSAVTGEHHCYDISSGTWSDRAPMPTPLFSYAYGMIDGKFYAAGGFDINFIGYNTLQIYDPVTDSWSSGAVLPTARGGQAGGVVNGKLYSAGGSGTSSFPADCPTYEYDPVADAWATRASCPLQGGYGFDLGGGVGSSYWNLFFAGGHFGAYYGWYAYDPVSDSWSTLANLPYHKTPLMVEDPTSGLIYSVGGMIGWTGYADVYVYDYLANTWSNTPPDLITAQGGSYGPAQGSFGDPDVQGIWTFGGTIGSGPISPAPFELYEYVASSGAAPVLQLTGPDLHAYHLLDMQSSMTMNVANAGNCPLEWSLSELPSMGLAKSMPRDLSFATKPMLPDLSGIQMSAQINRPGVAPAYNPEAILWDQPTANGYAVVSQYFVDFGAGVYSADDFVITEPWIVDHIFVDGFGAAYGLDSAMWLVWFIYADDGGVPAGYPDIGGQIWSFSAPANDPAITLSGSTLLDEAYLDVFMANNGNPLVLMPGRYWLIFYPAMDYSQYDQWFWDQSVTYNESEAYIIDPNNLFGGGWTDWTSWHVLNPDMYDTSFRIEGEVFDIPWLTEVPTYGILPSGWSTDIGFTFDSTGLDTGEYYGTLGLFSNDPNSPAILPAQLTVMEPNVHVNKTVGLTEETCQITDVINVVPGTEVVYCYDLMNTGTYTMTTHDLVDDQIGVLLDDFIYELGPGESVLITQSAVINEWVLNTAYYTATTEFGGFEASAHNAAIVNVVNPAIEFDKTVGLDPNTCATTDSVTVLPGTDVTYCYSVFNSGDITLTVHDLVDSELGALLDGFVYDLAPGASAYLTETATIDEDTENTATWTAWMDEVFYAEATDTAFVEVIEPAIELVKTVGLDPNVCATTDVITVPVGTDVTYCFTVMNTGDVTLTVHNLVDSELGNLLIGYGYDLGPGESVYITETATATADVTNTATWIAWVEAEGLYAEATDMATVHTYEVVTAYFYFLPVNYKK
jgi:uncharacterized repeat protein (TIGR01451 family)